MGSDTPVSGPRARWLALVAALLGWMFDGLEMGLFPLVGRPALRELFGPGVDARTRSASGTASSPPGSWSGRRPAASCSAGSATSSAGSGR